MRSRLDWRTAVSEAIERIRLLKNSKTFTRDELIKYELENIISDTNSKGRTLEQTLSKVLQELRDEGFIEFIDYDGLYKLID